MLLLNFFIGESFTSNSDSIANLLYDGIRSSSLNLKDNFYKSTTRKDGNEEIFATNNEKIIIEEEKIESKLDTSIKIDVYDSFRSKKFILPLDALECINYLETEYNFNSSIDKESVFALKMHKAKTKLKYVVVDFEKKKTLTSTRIFKNNTQVTSFVVRFSLKHLIYLF